MKIHPLDNQNYWDIKVNALTGELVNKADWVIHESYHVYAKPLIDPAEGGRSIEVNPYQYAPSPASPFGWHDTDGIPGAEYTITRGNNAHAYEDSSNKNASIGNEPDAGGGLVFDFPIDLGQQPGTYQDASVSHLFYWNNILHDIHYEYGFDEVSGNFHRRSDIFAILFADSWNLDISIGQIDSFGGQKFAGVVGFGDNFSIAD